MPHNDHVISKKAKNKSKTITVLKISPIKNVCAANIEKNRSPYPIKKTIILTYNHNHSRHSIHLDVPCIISYYKT